MTDIPDNVDLRWIARSLVASREEMLGLKKSDLHHIREGLRVIRIDTSLTALRDDLRQLHEMYRDSVGRVAAIEGSTPP